MKEARSHTITRMNPGNTTVSVEKGQAQKISPRKAFTSQSSGTRKKNEQNVTWEVYVNTIPFLLSQRRGAEVFRIVAALKSGDQKKEGPRLATIHF